MRKNSIRIMALGLFAVMIFALSGCSKNDEAENIQQMEAISEIDAFAMAVDMVKTHYDKNEMYKGQLEEASNQALIMEAFFDDTPNLYQDESYKLKITEIYNTVNSIEMGKEGLMMEEGSEPYFNSLKQIVTRMYNKSNN